MNNSSLKKHEKEMLEEMVLSWAKYIAPVKPHALDREKARKLIALIYEKIFICDQPDIYFTESPDEALLQILQHVRLKENSNTLAGTTPAVKNIDRSFLARIRVPISMFLFRGCHGSVRQEIYYTFLETKSKLDFVWKEHLKVINNKSLCKYPLQTKTGRDISFMCECFPYHLLWMVELEILRTMGIWDHSKKREPAFDMFEEIVRYARCGIYGAFFFDGLCVVCTGPELNPVGEFHAPDKPAIKWGSYEWFNLHGILFEPDEWHAIMERRINGSEIIKWENLEKKAAAIKHLGWRNIIDDIGAKIISTHETDHGVYEVIEVQLNDDHDIFNNTDYKARFVKVICPSTLKTTFLRVDSTIEQTKTPMGAISWTFGMTVEEYMPVRET